MATWATTMPATPLKLGVRGYVRAHADHTSEKPGNKECELICIGMAGSRPAVAQRRLVERAPRLGSGCPLRSRPALDGERSPRPVSPALPKERAELVPGGSRCSCRAWGRGFAGLLQEERSARPLGRCPPDQRGRWRAKLAKVKDPPTPPWSA